MSVSFISSFSWNFSERLELKALVMKYEQQSHLVYLKDMHSYQHDREDGGSLKNIWNERNKELAQKEKKSRQEDMNTE